MEAAEAAGEQEEQRDVHHKHQRGNHIRVAEGDEPQAATCRSMTQHILTGSVGEEMNEDTTPCSTWHGDKIIRHNTSKPQEVLQTDATAAHWQRL